jgi:hypothetical protein
MKSKSIIPQKFSLTKKIKVRLDYRTLIVLNDLSSLDVWRKRYPEARVIQ